MKQLIGASGFRTMLQNCPAYGINPTPDRRHVGSSPVDLQLDKRRGWQKRTDAKSARFGALRLHISALRRNRVKCLLVFVVEVIVCRVPLELSLTYGAGRSGGSSTPGVQALDEG